MNSRDKGKRGELELAHVLTDYGYDCRRGQQFCGLYGQADVEGIPGIHIECKRVEHLNLCEAMKQSVRDSRAMNLIPTVFHRKNKEEWLVTMRLQDWVEMERKTHER